MSKAPYPHPEDEFDRAVGAGRPAGVHRAPRSTWSRAWPFVVVLVAVPALAVAAVMLLGNGSGSLRSPLASSTDTPPVEETTDPPVEEPAPPTVEEPTPTPTADRALAVQVLNAAGVSGLAGRIAEQAGTAGWTDVTADNFSGTPPTASVVLFSAPEHEVTARALAADLGITTVSQSADYTVPITVVATRDLA